MENQILITLKKKMGIISAYGGIDAETQRNALKEELQFYVLNFIYHHPKYSEWIMYGGSALRICHDLNRMSVDLDFEVNHEITNEFLDNLNNEILKYFENTYNATTEFLTISRTNFRGLTLKFHVGKELGLDFDSTQIHVKIDLNRFNAPEAVVTERRPINHDQFSFAIKTYNMSALMASKLAAIFLRGQRGVNKTIYEEKGRDIYDLLWYMSKMVVPDLDYLAAKNVKFADPRELFNRTTIKILNKKNTDANLKEDLPPLFMDQAFIANWLQNWRNNYLSLLENYKITTVTQLEEIVVHQNFNNDVFSFVYWYKTEDNKKVRIAFLISDYWIEFGDGDLLIKTSEKVNKLYKFNTSGATSNPPSQEKIKQYAELFYQKTEKYLKKTNRIVLGDLIETKLIRMTADNLNPEKQILLNKPALLSCELDNLLK